MQLRASGSAAPAGSCGLSPEVNHLRNARRWHAPCGARGPTQSRGFPLSLVTIAAEPAQLTIDLEKTALIIIDMQRDFLEPGGFGAALGNDVARLQIAVPPCRDVLAAARRCGLLVIHTREGHRPDLSDAPPLKVERGDPALRIGAPGPMGRILIRGEPGHDIIPALYPVAGEPVIDKPG